MGIYSEEQAKTDRALGVVRDLADKRISEASEALLEDLPQKDLEYWTDRLQKAKLVDRWCFVEQMRINPD